MKYTTQTYLLLLLLIAGSFTLSSCSKDEDPKPELIAENTVTATMTLPDGSTVDYAGTVMGGAWWIWDSQDNVNILSIASQDKGSSKSILAFGISYADGPDTYSLSPNEFMANPATLVWSNMEYDNWMGFVTGDANGDGIDDGSGSFTITVLNEKHTEGTFSMVMGNDMGEKITVEGKFSCSVTKTEE